MFDNKKIEFDIEIEHDQFEVRGQTRGCNGHLSKSEKEDSASIFYYRLAISFPVHYEY